MLTTGQYAAEKPPRPRKKRKKKNKAGTMMNTLSDVVFI